MSSRDTSKDGPAWNYPTKEYASFKGDTGHSAEQRQLYSSYMAATKASTYTSQKAVHTSQKTARHEAAVHDYKAVHTSQKIAPHEAAVYDHKVFNTSQKIARHETAVQEYKAVHTSQKIARHEAAVHEYYNPVSSDCDKIAFASQFDEIDAHCRQLKRSDSEIKLREWAASLRQYATASDYVATTDVQLFDRERLGIPVEGSTSVPMAFKAAAESHALLWAQEPVSVSPDTQQYPSRVSSAHSGIIEGISLLKGNKKADEPFSSYCAAAHFARDDPFVRTPPGGRLSPVYTTRRDSMSFYLDSDSE